MANKELNAAGPKGRAERLAAELRANLSRRKTQARERRENPTSEAGDTEPAGDGDGADTADRPVRRGPQSG